MPMADGGGDRAGPDDDSATSQSSKLTGGLFLAGVAGFSLFAGFGLSLVLVKKKDPRFFAKGLVASREVPESGASLALRALAWGTLYSVAGVGTICLAVCKVMGVHSLKEFTQKMQSIMPNVPKRESEGRTEFKSIRDLFEYLAEEDKKNKKS